MTERHDASQARAIWPPMPGFFRLRLTRGGWPVPCRIVQSGEGWHAEVDGRVYDPHPDPAYAARVADVWTGGIKIAEWEWHWCVAVRQDALDRGETEHPALNPTRPMSPMLIRPWRE